MIDPRKFKAPYIPKERIWQEADQLRIAHPAGRSLSVKVLDLAEFDLHLDLVPVNGLREQLDIDALLMGDLKSILVDKRAFMSPRLEYRLRFSVAHEIGDLIPAYEFAGRLLVPPDALREAFQTAVQTAQAAGYSDWLAADEAALDYIATRIAPKFGVSVEVIAKRLRVEKLWPPA